MTNQNQSHVAAVLIRNLSTTYITCYRPVQAVQHTENILLGSVRILCAYPLRLNSTLCMASCHHTPRDIGWAEEEKDLRCKKKV